MDKDEKGASGEAKANAMPKEKLTMTDEEHRLMEERHAAKQEAFDQLLREMYPKPAVERESNGRFKPGTPTPNPEGRGAGKNYGQLPRRFGMSQTIKDLLQLLEEPVDVRKGKVTRKVPAIVAIYERMIHMAVGGEWNAMKKIVEMREKYSDIREKTLSGLLEQAQGVRAAYKHNGDEIPPEVRELLEYVEHRVEEGQFDAG